MFTKNILFLLSVSSLTIYASKVDLKSYMKSKGLLHGLEPSQYEVVYPFQIRDKNDRIGIETRDQFLNGTVHYSQITIVIRGNSIINRLKLNLDLNQNLFFNETTFNRLDARGEAEVEDVIENCYYQGNVNGVKNSMVALSTCDGLRGIISYSNGTSYQIIPLEGGEHGRRHPHLIYEAKWNQEVACGAVTLSPSIHSSSTFHNSRGIRDVTRQTKFVELALIADYTFYKMLNLSMTESIRYGLDVINTADLILARNLNVRLSIVYGEWWTDVERIDVNEDIEKTLSGVLDYTTGHIYNVKKDNTVFLTGSAFSHKEQASSTFASICTARALSLVKAIDRRQVFETSQLLAQSIGHNFGIDHDSLDCTCDNSNKCVMNKEAGSNGTPFIYGFSKCSQGRMHSALRSGELQCLLNKPFHTSELHHCGNGIVEGNEECDCGSKSREECTDPCCDPITCTLRAHAQCASHQSCCHRCELRKTGHICRTSRSPCDVIEICDGISADCPADGYLIDGTNCDIDGKCWKGDRCIKKDEYFSKKVCIDGSCLPLTKASPPVYCPSNNLALQCSGHGDCTTTQKCLCFDGWSGLSCDIKTNSSRRLNFKTNADIFTKVDHDHSGKRTIDTTTLLFILLGVAAFLFFILICLLFCYRRKSSLESVAQNIVFEKHDESFGENPNRTIKFGSMPRYSEEKRRTRRNKKVYDALNRISEVIDERDTNSMKSRESEHISVHNESSSIYGVGHNRQLPSRGNYVMCDDGTRIRHELSGSQRSLLRMNEPTLALHPNNIFDDTAERFYSQYDRGIRNSPCKSDYGGYTSKMKREPRSDLGYSTRNYEQPYEGIGNLYNDNDLACYSSRYSIQQPPYLPQSYKNISTMSPSSSSYTGSISKLKHTPLKLNNIQTLLKQLDDNDSACLDIRNMDTEESELSNGEHHQDRNSHPDSIPSADLGYSSNATYPCRETFSIAGNSEDGDTFPGRPSFLSERLKVDIPNQF